MSATRRLRISAANIGPNRFHQNRTVSWLMSIPRSAKRSSTFRSDSGYRTYIITTRRMTSGELLKSERIAHAPRLTQPGTAGEFALTSPLPIMGRQAREPARRPRGRCTWCRDRGCSQRPGFRSAPRRLYGVSQADSNMQEWLIVATSISVIIIDWLALIVIVAGTVDCFFRAVWTDFVLCGPQGGGCLASSRPLARRRPHIPAGRRRSRNRYHDKLGRGRTPGGYRRYPNLPQLFSRT